MQPVAIRREQNLSVEADSTMLGVPLARDHRVVPQVPPEVVGEILRPTLDLQRPFTANVMSRMKTPPAVPWDCRGASHRCIRPQWTVCGGCSARSAISAGSIT